MKLADRIFLAGHRGMVGSALLRALKAQGFGQIITMPHRALDLREGRAVARFFERHRPDYVLLAAAKVGGIKANHESPAEFLYDNLLIQSNVIHESARVGVKRLLFLGSSCVYPRDCPQPMREEYLMTGPLEPTNEGYALAKIAGLKMAQFYCKQHGLQVVCPMPCNLYGPNDSFDPCSSHVLSALVRKFVEAKRQSQPEVVLWGTGQARREFLHVEDAAAAFLFLMQHWNSPDPINVGSGIDLTIRELADLIANRVGYQGHIAWDTSQPDGMPRKCLNILRLTQLGFHPKVSLASGIDQVIRDYRHLKT